MEEEQKVPPQHPPVNHTGHANPWLFFKNQYEDIVSKVNLRKTFYEESKKNAKKVRSNKKNPTKNSSYYSTENAGNASPIYPSKKEDHIYQTAIPNTVIFIFELIFLYYNRLHTLMKALGVVYITVSSQIMERKFS